MGVMEDGAKLNLAEVLKFNRRWTDADRAVVREEIENTGGAMFTFRRGGYMETVAVTTAEGQPVMGIGKGTIWFNSGYTPNRAGASQDGDKWVLRLTTHQASSGEPRGVQAVGEICGSCFQTMSLTGELRELRLTHGTPFEVWLAHRVRCRPLSYRAQVSKGGATSSRSCGAGRL